MRERVIDKFVAAQKVWNYKLQQTVHSTELGKAHFGDQRAKSCDILFIVYTCTESALVAACRFRYQAFIVLIHMWGAFKEYQFRKGAHEVSVRDNKRSV